jgi:hypothetical protein
LRHTGGSGSTPTGMHRGSARASRGSGPDPQASGGAAREGRALRLCAKLVDCRAVTAGSTALPATLQCAPASPGDGSVRGAPMPEAV